jgi:hypothetical protein
LTRNRRSLLIFFDNRGKTCTFLERLTETSENLKKQQQATDHFLNKKTLLGEVMLPKKHHL